LPEWRPSRLNARCNVALRLAERVRGCLGEAGTGIGRRAPG